LGEDEKTWDSFHGFRMDVNFELDGGKDVWSELMVRHLSCVAEEKGREYPAKGDCT